MKLINILTVFILMAITGPVLHSQINPSQIEWGDQKEVMYSALIDGKACTLIRMWDHREYSWWIYYPDENKEPERVVFESTMNGGLFEKVNFLREYEVAKGVRITKVRKIK